MKTKNHFFSGLSLIVFVFLFIATAKEKEATKAPTLIPMKFDYTPPVEGVTKSNAIKFALINPRFVTSFEQSNLDPYKTFAKNMGVDFVEMLSARGYPYIGPYITLDDMVYSEKLSTDLVLDVEVDLQFSGDYLKHIPPLTSTSPDYYSYKGDMTLSGKVNLIFSEPFTKTKVWVKSVSIEPTTFFMDSQYKYESKNIPVTDPKVWNILTENLQTVYQKTLETAWKYLEPEELKVKKAESLEIKKNSGFQKK